MHKLIIVLFWGLLSISFSQLTNGQEKDNQQLLNYVRYNTTLDKLKNLLQTNRSFDEAIFLTETTYRNIKFNYSEFVAATEKMAKIVLTYYHQQKIKAYNQPDSNNYLTNHAIFTSLFDTIAIKPNNSISDQISIAIFSYLPHNSLFDEDYTNMFVSKLIQTGKGNCHSLSYLYKIIADKIGAKCWLALAPNHIYIKNFSQQYGWYNTELTSRSFPSDAWIMASGYISADAIRSKIYMDTLSNQQSIGLCVLDLAKAYEYETKNYYDGFILKCCDLVLEYHATNPMALLLKAETLKKVYLKQKHENAPTANEAYDDMEAAYITLAKLHYREMPKEMYDKWVKQIQHSSGHPKR
ncbi:MAG: hypothetical protein QM668_02515 [Agriterribacter sp.]